MKLVEERTPGGFAQINDGISHTEILQLTAGYAATVSFALTELNLMVSLTNRVYC
jgi:hypothetical protein